MIHVAKSRLKMGLRATPVTQFERGARCASPFRISRDANRTPFFTEPLNKLWTSQSTKRNTLTNTTQQNTQQTDKMPITLPPPATAPSEAPSFSPSDNPLTSIKARIFRPPAFSTTREKSASAVVLLRAASNFVHFVLYGLSRNPLWCLWPVLDQLVIAYAVSFIADVRGGREVFGREFVSSFFFL